MALDRVTTGARARLAVLCASLLACGVAHASGPWFEEAPPTLPFYLHRLPAKTLEQIDNETSKPDAEVLGPDFRAELETVVSRLSSEAPAGLVGKIDELLRLNRVNTKPPAAGWAGGPPVANLLHDVRDLLTATPAASAAEMIDYVRWRIGNAEAFGVHTIEQLTKHGESSRPSAALTTEVEQRIKNAPATLRPHLLYLRGAMLWRGGSDTDCQPWFQRVVAEHPQHPRAEAALFMEARSQLSRARSSQYTHRDPVLNDEHVPRAEQLFRSYLEKHPGGRFAGDALGWLGALAYDQRDFTTALKLYIQQTQLADHPELYDSALIMCERLLGRIASDPKDPALEEVAKHPREAIALLYLIVNTTESDDFNGEFDSVETVMEWKKNVLPRFARAVAAQKSLYDQKAWQPKYLAALAHAASGAGNHAEALQLLGIAPNAVAKSDDLLFARAVALQRSGRLPDAMRDYRALLDTFPETPFARAARLRLALGLQDSQQAGEAIVEFAKLISAKAAASGSPEDANAESSDEAEEGSTEDGAPPADASSAEPAQVRQLIDTLLNFAPLAQLEAPLRNPNVNELLRLRISRVLAQRYLAREDFTNARKFMTPAEWEVRAAGLEKLTSELATSPSGAARAQKLLALGDAWAAARKQLLNEPLDATEPREEVFAGEHVEAGLLRRENAKALLSAAAVDEELENREELRHATKYWLQAADAQPGSDVAAASLWRALAAMPRIADTSAYTLARAAETDAAGSSRTLFDRLRRECPNSREARELAVYWSLPSSGETDEWGAGRGYFDGSIYDSSFAEELATAMGIVGKEDAPGETNWDAVLATIRALPKTSAAMSATAFTNAIARLQQEIRRQFDHVSEAPLVNFADDLTMFAQWPNVTPAARAKYVKLRTDVLRTSAINANWSLTEGGRNYEDDSSRGDEDAKLLEEIRAAMKDPVLKSVSDFVEFLEIAVVANQLIDVEIEGADKNGEPYTYRSRDFKEVEELTNRFLTAHPKSVKREAATLLNARAVFMLSRPVFYKNWEDWPKSDRWEGAYPYVFHQQEPFQSERVLAALNGYLRPYGQGRYFPELRNYRADVAVRMRDWDRALDLTAAQAADAAHPDLYPDAARRYGDIFAQLANDENRAPLLTSIKSRAAAKTALEGFLNLDRRDHPLLYLKQYLADQLGLTLAEPAETEE